ncbi:DUF2726 domain-containing protein [Sphingomonas hankyongi]|uniref:DUF2726 domain-containing protein n=1 Tax=Sphingomonas hankyongi TaxID=2908209 RepID=A0ABT0S1F5_9SPHN|nr:DUF2726 domain-containing protein [Sphingomonas hankyongi]MCL6729484.1 DUF2726 domain-containing protein [Sphingomonas hankyongi]
MPPEIAALIDKPILLIALLFVGAMIGIYVERFVAWPNRQKWRRRKGWGRKGELKAGPWMPKHDRLPEKVPDAADQLRTVMNADFMAQALLNKSEARLFKAIDKMVLEMRPGWQVMAQVSLGEILRSADKDAYACINSKRVDLLIVDDECRPLHAIEYQGGAHFKGAHATAARDAVKKEALRRAGIGYVEVVGGEMSPAELRQVVVKLVQNAAA